MKIFLKKICFCSQLSDYYTIPERFRGIYIQLFIHLATITLHITLFHAANRQWMVLIREKVHNMKTRLDLVTKTDEDTLSPLAHVADR